MENKLQFASISFSPALITKIIQKTLCVTWNLSPYVQLGHSFHEVHSIWIHDEQIFIDWRPSESTVTRSKYAPILVNEL